MATISGTVDEVNLLQAEGTGQGTRKTYALSCSFGAVTAGDVCELATANTDIQSNTKSGKTFTIRHGAPGNPGDDSAGVAAYAGSLMTHTAGALALTLGTAAGVTAIRAATTGVQVIVVGDES